jgi:hypothetical protein
MRRRFAFTLQSSFWEIKKALKFIIWFPVKSLGGNFEANIQFSSRTSDYIQFLFSNDKIVARFEQSPNNNR